MADYDAIVIGAGLGGLTAGAGLAKQGRRVLVVEQGERIGGCCSSFERDGYSFDLGATILVMVEAIERVFESLGTRLRDELNLIPCEPLYTIARRDGTKIAYPSSDEGTVDALATISREDAEAWGRYQRDLHDLTDILYDTVFAEPVDSFGDFARLIRKRPALAKYLPTFLTSYESKLRQYFSDPALHTFAFQSLWFGLSPAMLPGAYALVPSADHRGIFYPKGGMIEIPRALERIGKAFGMEVRLETAVERVLVEDRRVRGIRLADGTEVTADVVVSNVNAKTLYQRLAGEEHLPWLVRRGVRSYDYSMGCAVLYLGVDGTPALDTHHTLIAPTIDEINGWWRTRESQPIPPRQFGLIGCATFADAALAPEGKHALTIPMMGTYRGVDWDSEKKRFLDDVVEFLSKGPVPGLAEQVEVASVATPLDFERRIGLAEGAILGLAQDLAHGTVFRPANKSKSIEGLYLAGSSTNPGGAVPLVMSSGIITAKLVERHEG